MKTIDRSHTIPISYQLQEIFHDNIDEGVWQSGQKIPAENELCEQYGVSLITVRRALKQLEIEGLIKRFQGKGTFIEDKKVKDLILQSLTGSFAFSADGQRNFSTTLIEKGVEKPNEKIIETLQLLPGEKIYKLVRIRNVEENPLYWTKVYIPKRLCPKLLDEDFENQSLYEILKTKYGLVAVSAVRTIETVVASSRAKNYLGVMPGTPLNLVSSVSYLKDGKPMEFSKNYFRSDRVKFEVKININK